MVIWALSFLIPVSSGLLKNGLALHVCGVRKGGAGSPGCSDSFGNSSLCNPVQQSLPRYPSKLIFEIHYQLITGEIESLVLCLLRNRQKGNSG